MRVAIPLRRSLFLLVATLVALAALLPLRLMLDGFGLSDRGLAARVVTGSVWRGHLAEAQLGGVPLGDLNVRLRVWPLLIGQARIDLSREDPAAPVQGSVTATRYGFGLDDVSATLDLLAADPRTPVGSLRLDQVDVRFSDGACTRAGGRVEATLAPSLAPLLPQGSFIGTLRCDSGDLLVPLSETSGVSVLNIRVGADGIPRSELVVQAPDALLQPRLIAAGFKPRGGPWVLTITDQAVRP